MNKAVLDYVINVLETDPDIFVPVKRLWLGLQDQGLTRDIGHDYEQFVTSLKDDTRFDVEPSVEEASGEPPPWPPEEEPEMEALGFFLGSRVKLTTRQLTLADLVAILERHTDSLMSALEGAWALRDPNDHKAQDLLLEALAQAQRLQRETRRTIKEAAIDEQTNPDSTLDWGYRSR